MKTMNMLKLSGLLFLVISFAVGCAAGPAEEPAVNGQAEAAQEAIASAKAALKRAQDEGYAWRDTGDLIKKAEAAAGEGKYDQAIELANEARRQSELAIQQKYDELERIDAAAAARGDTGGRVSSYTVSRGDSLWAISAKSEVYDDPYQWPLIYRANQDQIQDADLIYPGQMLQIDQSATSADVATAVRHARTRGAWTLGETEDSDRAYLGR